MSDKPQHHNVEAAKEQPAKLNLLDLLEASTIGGVIGGAAGAAAGAAAAMAMRTETGKAIAKGAAEGVAAAAAAVAHPEGGAAAAVLGAAGVAAGAAAVEAVRKADKATNGAVTTAAEAVLLITPIGAGVAGYYGAKAVAEYINDKYVHPKK